MKITLRERSGGMYISSIQAVDGQEIIGSVPATRPPETEAETLPVTAPVTEVITSGVAVTDENGEEVTDDDGEVVTEMVTIYQEVTTAATTEPVTDEDGNVVTQPETETTEEGVK